MTKYKKIFIIILFLFQNCYIMNLTWGQLDILNRRKPITKVINDPKTPNETRQKLLYIEKVRNYAENKIHLKVKDTYKYFSQLDRKVLSWNIIASEKLSLKTKTWKFPIIGEVPYLGYFNYNQAKLEANYLKKRGWDVRISEVAAYSTLGWFNDPLVSPQLEYSYWFLTTLLIHECTHATVWFVNDVPFNESLATFVGYQGALNYFKEEISENEYNKILNSMNTNTGSKEIFFQYTRKLQLLYSQNLPKEIKLEKRSKIFQEFENELISKGYKKPITQEDDHLNNVDLITYNHYNSGGTYFSYTYKNCKENWDCFFEKIKTLSKLTKIDRNNIWRKYYPK